MSSRWTSSAVADLDRLHRHLQRVAPEEAARLGRNLARAPERLLEFPRLGETLEAYAPREVKRVFVAEYELRYEVAGGNLFVLRLWHGREDRTVGPADG